MESKTNYTIVGLIVLILLICLIAAGLWLSVGIDRNKYDFYTIYMREAATGLSDDSVVKFNGVKVGSVDKIELNPFDPQQVKVILKIAEGTPVTTSTQATLINQGITGTTYLGLSATSPTLIPLQKTPGEPYPVIPYKPSFLSQLEETIDDISLSMKRILDKKSIRAIKKTLLNIQEFTNVLAQNKQNLDQSLKDMPKLLSEIQNSAHKFNVMANDLSTAGKHITVAMDAGKNSINKFSQQAIPPAVLLLQRMDLVIANLEKVSAQMRQNPAVVIRGNAPPQSGPGE